MRKATFLHFKHPREGNWGQQRTRTDLCEWAKREHPYRIASTPFSFLSPFTNKISSFSDDPFCCSIAAFCARFISSIFFLCSSRFCAASELAGAVDGFLIAAVIVGAVFALPFCACVKGLLMSLDPFGACGVGGCGF
jgi:hypothetical protein